MPLVRYEIRNEHSLANPQLYRTAATDDPEGLLEGVAMAGLVGIVRQLGDLAEFAAEVFRDLHEEVMATASRGHELLVRVQQLEAEMPAVEKALLSETNQLRFAYTPGVEWHASIRNDQNHCTQGDLPRFIRNSYEECRGPPRLFLLDKFDVAGAGACLKRYTDPSFFRTEWASSELMKAERVQRDKKARREKKKGRRRRNVDAKESRSVDPFQSRFSQELSRDLAEHNPHSRTWHHSVSERSDEVFEQDNTNYNENVSAISRHLAQAQALGRNMKSRDASQGFAEEAFTKDYVDTGEPILSEVTQSTDSVKQTAGPAPNVYFKDLKSGENGPGTTHMDEVPVESKQDAAYDVDDVASEGEQFLDALTTMESEADTDSEPGFKQDKEMNGDRTSVERVRDTDEVQSTLQENLKSPRVPDTEFEAYEASTARSRERLAADKDLHRPVIQNEDSPVQTSQGLEEGMRVLPPAQTPTEEEVPLSGLGSPTKLRDVSTRNHPEPGVQWNGSAKQYSPKSQDYPKSPRFDQVSADGFSKMVSSPRALKVPDIAGPDFSEDTKVQPSKQDLNGSLNSTIGAHLRKKSTDPVFSSSSRKVYPGESMEGHRENLQAIPKVSIFKSDSRSTSMRSEHEDVSPSPIGAAVKVSKMVAAFETRSLDQIQGIDRKEEPRANGRESSLLESTTAPVNTGNGSFIDAPRTEGTSVQDSYSPVIESPASGTSNSTNDSSGRSLPQPPKLRVEISPSRRVSVGSVDSPSHSPIFSALHSPMSPIRISRNILSSPDSPGLGFSSQLLLSPTSPTSVPVLDNSPTSKKNPPSIFSRKYDNEFQVVSPPAIDEPFSSVSSPFPVELPPNQSRHHAAFMSPAHLHMLHDGPTSSTMPPEEWNSHFSPSSLASPDDIPAASPDLVPSQRRWPMDNSEELESTVITNHDVVGSSKVGEELHSSPGTPQEVDHSPDNGVSAQVSPRSHVDEHNRDIRRSPEPEPLLDTEPFLDTKPLMDEGMTSNIPILRVEVPDEVLAKEGVVHTDPAVSATSPISSASHHSLSPTFSEVGRDKAPLPVNVETANEGTTEQVQQETSLTSGPPAASHKRFPSLPPSETTSQDLSLPFSKASIPSRSARVGPGPASRFVHELPFRSPPSRTINDLPFPVPRGAHRRYPSFPSSEKATLDLASIASTKRLQDTLKEFVIPSKPMSDVGIQPSKKAHGPPSSPRPTEELHPLPPPSPPSTSKREVVSPPPLPFRTLHELPPPPPPSRSPPTLTGSKSASGADALRDAIASHDKTTLKKVKTMQNPSLRKGDDRAHLMEQIRAQSFNLRHTVVEKYEQPLPRPVTNINVAAILEKANAIRQAFAGSDEDDEDDDDWSDV